MYDSKRKLNSRKPPNRSESLVHCAALHFPQHAWYNTELMCHVLPVLHPAFQHLKARPNSTFGIVSATKILKTSSPESRHAYLTIILTFPACQSASRYNHTRRAYILISLQVSPFYTWPSSPIRKLCPPNFGLCFGTSSFTASETGK